MHTRLLTATALSGALIALAACGGGGDDDAADPGTTIEIAGESPGDDTAPAEDGEAGDGNECPLLSDDDAAQAVGVETLTSSEGGRDICAWTTPDGVRAFSVYKTEPFPPKSMTDAERAKAAGTNTCGMSEPRSVEIADGAAIVCDAGLSVYGYYFINGQQYNVEVGDTSNLSPDDAEVAARIDTAANVIAKLKLPDG